MKLPALYLKTWKLSDCEPDQVKAGLNWWLVSCEPRDRGGLDFIHPWGRFELVWATNAVRYEKDIEKQYRGMRIL